MKQYKISILKVCGSVGEILDIRYVIEDQKIQLAILVVSYRAQMLYFWLVMIKFDEAIRLDESGYGSP